MKYCISLLILFLHFVNEAPLTITGTIVDHKGEGIPGCQIVISKNNAASLTDLNGNFSIETALPKSSNFDVLIKFTHSPQIRIHNVKTNGKIIDLGNITLFHNHVISIEEYERLDEVEKADYKAIYHWVNLLGYYHPRKVEAENNFIPCPYNLNKMIEFQYNSEKNEATVSYEHLLNCK